MVVAVRSLAVSIPFRNLSRKVAGRARPLVTFVGNQAGLGPGFSVHASTLTHSRLVQLKRFELKPAFRKLVDAVIKDGVARRTSTTTMASRNHARAQSVLDLAALPDTNHISKVVAAIRNGEVKEGSIDADGKLVDSHLRLPEDTAWPIATNNVLFVRKYYAPLLEKVFGFCRAAKRGELSHVQRHILTGQPGIGKSVWIWYVIYRMLRHPEHKARTIIVVFEDTSCGFVIPPAGPLRAFSLSEMSLARFGDFPDLGEEPLFIADSLLPPVLPMPTLVVSSLSHLANRDLNNTLHSYRLQWLYMPIPDAEEVLQMHKTCFCDLDEEGVKRRMELWGPIPRHVLVCTDEDDQEALWEREGAVKVHVRAAGQDAEPNTPEADITSSEYYHRGRKVVLASRPMMR